MPFPCLAEFLIEVHRYWFLSSWTVGERFSNHRCVANEKFLLRLGMWLHDASRAFFVHGSFSLLGNLHIYYHWVFCKFTVLKCVNGILEVLCSWLSRNALWNYFSYFFVLKNSIRYVRLVVCLTVFMAGKVCKQGYGRFLLSCYILLSSVICLKHLTAFDLKLRDW